ncbi:Uncharacterized protein dnm_050550 [Desulfonema magnum]|uniref:Uncharacterized protein n=1 Tax=Desulfonema magnum TaxID=45655 RepID=A0A975GQJ1_9BACT|nr:Uncharacterized protein dnm_050550 [Desulfonema magnum]
MLHFCTFRICHREQRAENFFDLLNFSLKPWSEILIDRRLQIGYRFKKI